MTAPTANPTVRAPSADVAMLTCLACGMRMAAGTAACPRCDAPTGPPVLASQPKPQSAIQPQSQVQDQRTCPSCGLVQRGNSKFCTSCGTFVINASAIAQTTPAPTTAAPLQHFVTCTSCGMRQGASNKFCTACGGATRTGTTETAGAPVFCTRCGTRRPANAKFCTSCGMLFGNTGTPTKPPGY
jgi:membrane protease subunit (stomatin/prohibitin family)